MTDLAALAWPDVAGRAAATVLALPVGATEQHGPHLPLATDTEIAVVLARRLAESRPDVVVAPALAYGSSGEHAGFPGTLSVGQEVVELTLVELIRSADAFAGVVVISTHGGNAQPVRRAVRRLTAEGRRVRVWWPPSGDPTDAHAGYTETSVLLAARPEVVQRRAGGAGCPAAHRRTAAGAAPAGGGRRVAERRPRRPDRARRPPPASDCSPTWTRQLVAALEWPTGRER